jgi:hypothetical protein
MIKKIMIICIQRILRIFDWYQKSRILMLEMLYLAYFILVFGGFKTLIGAMPLTPDIIH